MHVQVWQEAYAGLLPADYLAALDPTAGPARWRERIERPPGVDRWVARDDDGIVGMATSGPGRDDDAPGAARAVRDQRAAPRPRQRVADDLMAVAVGDRAAYLWVLDGNDRARAFYRRHGFADDGGRKPEPDTGVVEIRMSRAAVVR